MGYIGSHGVAALHRYKYSGVDHSYVAKYVLQPFWTRFVNFFPYGCREYFYHLNFDFIITLMGFMFLLVSALLGYIYSPHLDSPPPRWVHFAHGLLLFLYQTFDAVDGKQARRTNSSSPLGELFDHGCDALACTFEALAFGSTAMCGRGTFWWWLISAITFYGATWEHYFTNTLILPVINGPTEGLMIIYIAHFFTAIVGLPTFKAILCLMIAFGVIPTVTCKYFKLGDPVRYGNPGHQNLQTAFVKCIALVSRNGDKISKNPSWKYFFEALMRRFGEEESGTNYKRLASLEQTRRAEEYVQVFELLLPKPKVCVTNVYKVVKARNGNMPLALAMLYPFVVLVGGVLMWYKLNSRCINFVPSLDYLSPSDIMGRYPHLVIIGTGLTFGYLVGRMILSHLCDEPKGLKTGMCMSLVYLPLAIANVLASRLNDGVPLLDERLVLLGYCAFSVTLYLHFATSVIHEITNALGIYCFRITRKEA
ncbi:hypothetical protein ACSQ67_005783 [Phaseolus vulgaris]